MSDIKRYSLCEDVFEEEDDGYIVFHDDHIKAMQAKDAEIERLKQVMTAVRDDLVSRADLKGEHHVGLSSSQWISLCEATQPPTQDKA